MYLVPLTRFERVTCALGVRCSIQLSYRGGIQFKIQSAKFKVCLYSVYYKTPLLVNCWRGRI